MTEVDTPGKYSIDEVSSYLKIDPAQTIKTLLVRGTGGAIALLLRGDHELNTIKAEKLPMVAKPLELIGEAEVKAIAGCEPGSIGPIGLDIPVIADESAARLANFVCGANEDNKHLVNVNWGRDLKEPEVADLRNVVAGDPCPRAMDNGGECSGTLQLHRGIEVGHVFQLGTKYSEKMNATVLDENGNQVIMPMGCYGIGVSRIVAAAIEQNHDDRGIIWPDALAPFHVALVPIGLHKSEEVRKTADDLYQQLAKLGVEVLFDDRNERPGVMFADSDLIGIPHRIVVGDRGLKNGQVEYKGRRDAESIDVEVGSIVDLIREKISQ
jgi:prolyl-tRNA synthetase